MRKMAEVTQTSANRENLSIDLDVPAEGRGVPEGEEGAFTAHSMDDFEEDNELSLEQEDTEIVSNAQLSE